MQSSQVSSFALQVHQDDDVAQQTLEFVAIRDAALLDFMFCERGFCLEKGTNDFKSLGSFCLDIVAFQGIRVERFSLVSSAPSRWEEEVPLYSSILELSDAFSGLSKQCMEGPHQL